MDHIVHNILLLCDDPKINISDWFHFVSDRTKSIRQDIQQQKLFSPGLALVIERCVRFHIFCAARLVSHPDFIVLKEENAKNLNECLQSLLYMYDQLSLQSTPYPNEAEFLAYMILLNLNDSNILSKLKEMPAFMRVQNSAELQFALRIHMTVASDNYIKFFSLISTEASYMCSCISLQYFTQMREKALKVLISKSYKRKKSFMCSDVQNILLFDSLNQCKSFMEHYGVKGVFKRNEILTKSGEFKVAKAPFILTSSAAIDYKKATSIMETVYGTPSDAPFEISEYKIENSFDVDG